MMSNSYSYKLSGNNHTPALVLTAKHLVACVMTSWTLSIGDTRRDYLFGRGAYYATVKVVLCWVGYYFGMGTYMNMLAGMLLFHIKALDLAD